MNRRNFFSFFGASTATAAVAAKTATKDPAQTVSPAPAADPFEGIVAWQGDSLESSPAAQEILTAYPFRFTEEQESDLLEFYRGRQWDSDVHRERRALGRPALVINKLPIIVSRALEATVALQVKGHWRPQLTSDQKMALILSVTKRNMDAQRFYNYFASAQVEHQGDRYLRFVSGSPEAYVAHNPICECGHALLQHGGRYPDPEAGFLTCSNQRCRLFNIPFARPRMHLRPADPAVVAKVRDSEREERSGFRGNTFKNCTGSVLIP